MRSQKQLFPILLPVLGAATALLRLVLEKFCTDEKGLIPSGHPLKWLIWLVFGAAVIITVIFVRKQEGSARYERNFSPSVVPAIGAIALAGGVFVSVMLNLTAFSGLQLARNVAGLLCIPALVYTGLWRWKGKQPFFLGYGLICLFFTIHTVSHYPQWSSQPQMIHYIFTAMACLFLMLFSYHQTAFCVGMGKRQMQLATGLLAAFCCMAAPGGSGDGFLYLTAGLWAITNLCDLTPRPAEDGE